MLNLEDSEGRTGFRLNTNLTTKIDATAGTPGEMVDWMSAQQQSQFLKYNQWVVMQGSTGGVFLTGPTTRSCGRSHSREEALLVEIVPLSASRSGQAVLKGDPFYLRTRDQQYLQRGNLISESGDLTSVHGSERFDFVLSRNPTQTVDIPWDDANQPLGSPILLSSEIGITFGGTAGNGFASTRDPNNSNRRAMTLRDSDNPSCVVNWWAAHERLRFHAVGGYNL
ncbi:hypothetical protein Pelo_4793 [Pelomyxa schiedti]|nr:hypothetical protein Pelo_4793 [Pelomyxa schiedti]